MKKAIFLTLWMAAISGFAIAQNARGTEQAVRHVDDEFHGALKAGDAAALDRLLTPGFIWTHSTGEVQNRATLLADVTSGDLKYGSVRTDDVKASVYKNSAVVSGHSVRNYPGENEFQLRYTAFYVNEGSHWRLAALQTAIFPDPRSKDEITRTLLKMENDWAQVDVNNDRSVFERILAPEFVSTSRSGKFLGSRQEYLADWEYERVQTAVNSDMKVYIYSDSLAVVTGVDTTTGTDANGVHWMHQDRFTDTYARRNGAWQCVAAQVTRIK